VASKTKLLVSRGTLYAVIASATLTGMSGAGLADCHQTHSCMTRWGVNEPFCETAKAINNKACNGCLASHALQLGVTFSCVACVYANFAAAAAGTLVCLKVCGSAAAVERALHVSGC
jgi:hypothetical protein